MKSKRKTTIFTRIKHVRDSRFAPQYPNKPIRKIMTPKIIKEQTKISIGDNGNELKLNR